MLASFAHLIYQLPGLADTLVLEIRVSSAKFTESVSSINPFAFVRISAPGGTGCCLKRLATVFALTCTLEGRGSITDVQREPEFSKGYARS